MPSTRWRNRLRRFANKFGKGKLLPGLAAIALLTAGCGTPPEPADFTFINGAEPETLDPALITGQPEGRLATSLFEGLAAYNQRGEAVPGVAESWEISEDGLVYLFQLRPDARWSNGDPVTAHDFVWSWQRTLSPETASEYAYQLWFLKNGRPYNEGELKDFSQVGVRALSDYELEVVLENPTPFFIDLCAFVTLLPVHRPTVEKFGDEWVKPGYLVGNGPYTLEEWRINDRIRLRRNEQYWDREAVDLKIIDVLPINRATTALNYFSRGLADMIMDKGLIPTALLDDIREEPWFHTDPFLGNYFIRFNVTRPPFDDPRVRLAFAKVIDKERITRGITRAGEQPAYSLVPPGTAGYQPPAGVEYDPETGRRLLAEAGFPDGQGFPMVDYLFAESDLNEAIAVELQEMFRRELGVRINLRRQEWRVYLNSLSQLDYDLGRSSWVGDYNDPNTFLDMFIAGGGNNRTGWSSPAYDQLIAEAAATLDQERRFDIFRRAEQILITAEAPIVPLYYYVGVQLYDPEKWGGIEGNLLDEHPLKNIYRRPEASP